MAGGGQKTASAACQAQFQTGLQNNFLIPVIWAIEIWQWLAKTQTFEKSTPREAIFEGKMGSKMVGGV